MGWNRSEFYAIAVGHLADRIAGAGTLQNPPPVDTPSPQETRFLNFKPLSMSAGTMLASQTVLPGPQPAPLLGSIKATRVDRRWLSKPGIA